MLNSISRQVEFLAIEDETVSVSMILGRDSLRIFGLTVLMADSDSDVVENVENYFMNVMNIEIETPEIVDILDINQEIPLEYN